MVSMIYSVRVPSQTLRTWLKKQSILKIKDEL